MTSTAEHIKKQIAVHEKRIKSLREELKEAESEPKPGDVLVDQHGKVYIASIRMGSVLELWAFVKHKNRTAPP